MSGSLPNTGPPVNNILIVVTDVSDNDVYGVLNSGTLGVSGGQSGFITRVSFSLPNTQGRTIRGVGTSGTTTVNLAEASGADDVAFTIADFNLPPHRHRYNLTGGGNATVAGLSQNATNGNENYTSSTFPGTAGTLLDATNVVVPNTPITLATLNQYLGINYIIKYM